MKKSKNRMVEIIHGIILLLIFSITTASASNLAVIKIDSENVTFINHTSDIQGNWINLSGGTSIRIPEITFNYSGVSTINYTKNSKNINITSPANYEVRYPFTTLQMYANNSNVNATFFSSSDLTGNIDIYLTKTHPTELRDIASRVIDGNTTPFRNLLNASINKTLNISLSSPNQLNFGSLSAGDYVVIVMKNESNQNNLTIVSSATFQVLEHNLTATVSGSVQRGTFIDIPLNLDAGGTFTYGAFLIHNDSYKGTVRLRSNGTKSGTNLSADSQSLIDAFKVAGIGLNNVNKSTVQNIVNGVIGANNGTVVFKPGASNSTSLSLTTDDLKLGRYVLSVGVWSNIAGERLVGFYQREIEVTSVVVDNTPPVITITSPANGSTLNVLKNSVIGSITDDSDISSANLTLNNVLVTNLSKGSFNVKVNYTAGATNSIKVFAKDIAGNTNRTEFLVNVLPNNVTVITNISANQTVAINASETLNRTNTVIELNATIAANVTVSINASTNASALGATPATTAYGLAQNQRSLDKYIQVNVTGIDTANLTFVTLAMYYTIADLDRTGDGDADDPGDLNEQTLKMYWFNPNTSLWMPLGPDGLPDYTSLGGPKVLDSERNTTAKYLKNKLNHFSTFGLVAEVVTAPSAGVAGVGAGAGAGGGGVTTSEPYDNIAKAESYGKDLIANTPVTYTFKAPEHGIYELVVTGKESENDIAIRIEALKGTSKLVSVSAPGVVYKNMNIWAGTKRIKEALIRFKVENSWIVSNSLASSDMKMLKWDGNKWVQLDTFEKTKDAIYSYYEVKTDTFSQFAISGIKGIVIPTATPGVIETPGATPGATGTVIPQKVTLTDWITGLIGLALPKAGNLENLAWIYAIIALVIIASAVYFLVIKRKK